MAYLLLIIGIFLVALTYQEAVGQWGKHSIESFPEKYFLPSYLQNLESKVSALENIVQEIKSKGEREKIIRQKTGIQPLKQNIMENKPLPTSIDNINEEILAAYKQGKGVTELAKEFGKGKGEIELILNLKN
ncbi:hypothetical protein RDV78_03400 [Bacillota bacterium LX-D]|nr:hypothetical protein [Bacillota bacterium LX-D]